VGLPRESKICLALIPTISLITTSFFSIKIKNV